MGRRIAQPKNRRAALLARMGRPAGWIDWGLGKTHLYLRRNGRLYNRNGWDMTDEAARPARLVDDGKGLVHLTREGKRKGGRR